MKEEESGEGGCRKDGVKETQNESLEREGREEPRDDEIGYEEEEGKD